ncbi:unnamed protein product [Vitrella brassicaformis CCMP3155]|uniref:AP-2 complex subunit alpha n=1 Tax=Vitrella brassicaformis (strain CCMP3155) TaxID=1169540 RepID=A0A0G4H4X0_VITBC|nr:unnamed protein product [Vitrella brassicaformis CCMP3155]|eukprot:CEM38603.1 unnamed protein product [Vitrella brassicaformis CCMP3155]
MPSGMKGLTVFVADIRNCPNKEAEQKRVDKELAKIRQKFTNSKSLSGYDRKKYIWKLLYAFMLGYDIDFGHMEAVNLVSSNKYSEKNAGYLACSLLLSENSEILRLITNMVKNDILHGNEHQTALALNTCANLGGEEFSENLFSDIAKLITPGASRPSYIRRKAYVCLLRLYRRDYDTIQPDTWAARLGQALQSEKDTGVLTSMCSLILGVLETDPNGWDDLVQPAILTLARVMGGDCPPFYVYYSVPAPWLQIKLLRILQFFPAPTNTTLLNRMNDILYRILSKPTVSAHAPHHHGKKRTKADAERLNRSNTEHAVLFEALNLIIHLEMDCDLTTKKMASSLLGNFVASKEANIRYLGLETMARLASDPDVLPQLKRHTELIIGQLQEPDISIRRQALNLLYGICDRDNWQQIVDELLEILKGSDVLMQEELVLKIAILAERNAPDYTWYVDVVFKMIEYAPEVVSDEIWYRVVQVVTGFDDNTDNAELQQYAAKKAIEYLNDRFADETMVRLGAYLIGEFGHHLQSQLSTSRQFQTLHRHFPRVGSSTRCILLLAYAKLLNADEDVSEEVLAVLEEQQDSVDPDLQQRAVELYRLCNESTATMENVLAMMPVFSEKIQSNNPLIRRMKQASKSRAAPRQQLEEAAKTEGVLFKTGVGPAAKAEEDDDHEEEEEEEQDERNGRRDEHDEDEEEDEEEEEEDEEEEEEEEEDRRNGPRSRGAAGGGGRGRGEADSGPAGGGLQLPPTAPGDIQGMWKNLCITPQGPMFQSNSLVIQLRHEYRLNQGRIAINYANKSPNVVVQFPSVTISEAPFMRHQASKPPDVLRPGETYTHQVMVDCLQPYLNPPKYIVNCVLQTPQGPPSNQNLPFTLPVCLTKFFSPASLSAEQFTSYWESMSGPGREMQLMGPLASGFVADVQRAAGAPQQLSPQAIMQRFNAYLSQGFNLAIIPLSNAPGVLFGAATFHTGTPQPNDPSKKVVVACMMKLELDPSRMMARLTARTAHPQVTTSFAQILAAYFITPQQQQQQQPEQTPQQPQTASLI